MTATERGGAKWDRAARYLQIAMQLHGHPEGISAEAIAERIGVSKRTVYRDLQAMDSDAALPIWQDKGRWGLDAGAFLPPLALTRDEAMTFFLAARLLARASDERDTELIGAFVKLAQILPPVLADHLRATVDAYATTPRNERFTRIFRVLTQAWAERRVVDIEYGPGVYDHGQGPQRRRVRPLAIEPSAITHAIYLIAYDEERAGRRTFKVERILDASLTPETFEADAGAPFAGELLRAWDVITDQPHGAGGGALQPGGRPARRRRPRGTRPRRRSRSRTGGSPGRRGSRASRRSAPGSWAGAAKQRSWSPPSCATASARSWRPAVARYR